MPPSGVFVLFLGCKKAAFLGENISVVRYMYNISTWEAEASASQV
jgi:hypothetical protein